MQPSRNAAKRFQTVWALSIAVKVVALAVFAFLLLWVFGGFS